LAAITKYSQPEEVINERVNRLKLKKKYRFYASLYSKILKKTLFVHNFNENTEFVFFRSTKRTSSTLLKFVQPLQ